MSFSSYGGSALFGGADTSNATMMVFASAILTVIGVAILLIFLSGRGGGDKTAMGTVITALIFQIVGYALIGLAYRSASKGSGAAPSYSLPTAVGPN